jgi:hypothetical protein
VWVCVYGILKFKIEELLVEVVRVSVGYSNITLDVISSSIFLTRLAPTPTELKTLEYEPERSIGFK